MLRHSAILKLLSPFFEVHLIGIFFHVFLPFFEIVAVIMFISRLENATSTEFE